MRPSSKPTNTPGDDPVPIDIDEFRYELAQRINRLIAARRQLWRTCPERTCRRHRACAAPRIRCSNLPPSPPDPDGRRIAGVMAMVQRALREHQPKEEGK